VTDNIVQGFAPLLPFDKIASILEVLSAPFTIQSQNTINKHSQIIPKDGLTHDQSWKWQSKMLVNSIEDTKKLMQCYFWKSIKKTHKLGSSSPKVSSK
jgi:hypothetical protein